MDADDAWLREQVTATWAGPGHGPYTHEQRFPYFYACIDFILNLNFNR